MSSTDSFQKWIQRISFSESSNESTKAFNFGIIETTNGHSLYLIGAKIFDPDDDDWATTIDFEPSEKYFRLKEEECGKNWKEVLDYSVELISNYVKSAMFNESLLKNATAITTGFDDGDLIRIL